jgi:hypothetical protein
MDSMFTDLSSAFTVNALPPTLTISITLASAFCSILSNFVFKPSTVAFRVLVEVSNVEILVP